MCHINIACETLIIQELLAILKSHKWEDLERTENWKKIVSSLHIPNLAKENIFPLHPNNITNGKFIFAAY
jgi:hypothetical protein